MKRNEDLNETVRLLFVLIIVFTFSRDSWGPSSRPPGESENGLASRSRPRMLSKAKFLTIITDLSIFRRSQMTGERFNWCYGILHAGLTETMFGNLKFFVQLTRKLWTVQFLRSVAFLSASSFMKWQLCREFLWNADEALQFRFAFMDY